VNLFLILFHIEELGHVWLGATREVCGGKGAARDGLRRGGGQRNHVDRSGDAHFYLLGSPRRE